MADQQASTLAFLQNFYTNVALYIPAERAAVVAAAPLDAPGLAAAAVAAPAPVAAATVAPVAALAATKLPLPALPVAPAVAIPVAAAAAGKLPSLAALPLAAPAPARAAPVAPSQAANQPAAPVVVAATPLPVEALVAGPPPTSLPAIATPLTPAAPPAPVAPAAEVPGYLRTTFHTLGSNAQGVVLLVRLPEAQFQKLPRNVFLNKLLQAIGLVMADVVLVNVDGPYPVALENLRREITATQVLAFGKNLLDVAVRTTQIYEPVLFPALGLSYLAAAEVEMVEYEVSLKKRLWAGLKAMFL